MPCVAYLNLTVCINGSNAVPLFLSRWVREQLFVGNGHLTKTRVTTKTRLTHIERQTLKITRNTKAVLFTKEWTAQEREIQCLVKYRENFEDQVAKTALVTKIFIHRM